MSLLVFEQLANIWGKEFLVTCLFKKEKSVFPPGMLDPALQAASKSNKP